MRVLFLVVALAFAMPRAASGQLSYLGPDKLSKGGNPYASAALAGGIVELGGDLYFTTPTGRLFRSNGTEDGTKVVYTAKGQSMPVLAATRKYLYIGVQDPGYASFMHRYTPGDAKLEALKLENPVRNFRFNNVRVPGYNRMSDALAVSPDRKYIAFRIFMDDAMSINVISDDAPELVKLVKYCSKMEIASLDLSIYVGSEIAFVRDEIFVNGHERDLLTTKIGTDGAGNPTALRTGARAFSASSVRKTPNDATTWHLGSYYHLESKGYTLYQGLLKTGNDLYSLVSKSAANGPGDYQLVRYDSTKLLLSNDKLPGGNYYRAEAHDGSIYLLTTGTIYRYDAKADRFITVFSDGTSGFNAVFDNDLLLKSGKYLLVRSRERLLLIDEATGSFTDFKAGTLANEPNRFSFGDRYAWATQRAFYTVQTTGGSPVFTQFNPATKTQTAIPMPEIDRAAFVEFRAVFQHGNRFLILSEYRDRKGASVYHMFMYKETGV